MRKTIEDKIQVLNEGLLYKKEGGITQIIIPAELEYQREIVIVGPKLSPFSGERALNFVFHDKNLIDKTLLINIKLVKVEKGFAEKKEKTISRVFSFKFYLTS